MIYIAYVFLLLSVFCVGLALMVVFGGKHLTDDDFTLATSLATCFGVLAIAFKVIFA